MYNIICAFTIQKNEYMIKLYYQELRSYRHKWIYIMYSTNQLLFYIVLHLHFAIVKSHTSININNVGEQLLLKDILDLLLVETPSPKFACWTPGTFSSPFAVSELYLL